MRRFSMIAAVLWVTVLTGCTSSAEEKTPEELLSLSVSGLSGVDRYSFKGSTGIILADGILSKNVTFHGTIEGHNRMRLKADDEHEATVRSDIGQPLEWLKRVQESAKKTELLSDASDIRTAVLNIETDEDSARREWEKKLTAEFNLLTRKQIAQAGKERMLAKNNTKISLLQREMIAEVEHSRKQMERMLQSIRVKTVYRLTIDRKRLLPINLQENTEFRFCSNGENRLELRKSELTIQTD